jgi:hypothetical protein
MFKGSQMGFKIKLPTRHNVNQVIERKEKTNKQTKLSQAKCLFTKVFLGPKMRRFKNIYDLVSLNYTSHILTAFLRTFHNHLNECQNI